MRTIAAAVLFVCWMAASTARAAIDPDAAHRAFAAFSANCSRDDGALWGVSLCGTVVIVDQSTRDAVASDGWSGKLPDNIGMANTAFDWNGTRASMVMWPLPIDEGARDRLLLHERFHSIQDRVGLPMSSPSANAHLDTLEGRYLMRLEMRALRDALLALGKSPASARKALADALTFRRARFEKFPAAAEAEASLDRNEGMADYTGVRLFTTDASRVIERAVAGLSEGEKSPAFPRSYAYATGPAWGLLLDEFRSGWRKEIQTKTFEDLFARPAESRVSIERRAAGYGGATVLADERKREEDRQRRVASYAKRFVEGRVLALPLRNMSMQMDPYDVHPWEGHGTVYEHITVSDDWGKIVVDNGALISGDFKMLTVSASPTNLTLATGWRIAPGVRAGDQVVTRAAQ